MKRVVVMICVLGMLVSSAMATNGVSSVNVVGFQNVEIPPDGLALVTVSFLPFTNATLQNLIGDQLPSGSEAYIWDRVSSGYIVDSRTRTGWTKTNIILRGDALWLRPKSGTGTNSVQFSGEVPSVANGAASTTITGLTGLNAIGYAYPADVVWTNTPLSLAMPSAGELYVWDPVAGYEVFSKSRTGWSTPDGYTIPAGKGFWVNMGSATNDWTQVIPYSL